MLWTSNSEQTLADEGLLCGWGGGVWLLLHEEHVGRDAEWDAFFFKGEDDAAAQGSQDGVALVGADADVDRVDDFAAADFVDAEDVGVGDGDVFEGGIVADLLGEREQDAHDFVGVGAGVYADRQRGDGVVAGEVGDGGDLAVGDDVECAVSVADARRAEGEVFDDAFESGNGHCLADIVLVFDEDEEAVDHVLEHGLRAEADADADDAGRSQDGLVGDVEDVEYLEQRDEGQHGVGRSTHDRGDGAELRRALEVADVGVRSFAQAMHEEQDDALEDEQDQKDGNEFGHLIAYEVDDIVVPAALDGLKQVLVLRGHCLEEHH